MNRRKLLSLATLCIGTWLITPLHAKIGKPQSTGRDPWKAEKSSDAIKLLYPNKEIIKSDRVKIIVSKLTENRGSIPVRITSDIEAKTVMLFQDANPTALTAIFEVPKDALVDYEMRIKIIQASFIAVFITVIIEDINGVVYMNNKEIDVSI